MVTKIPKQKREVYISKQPLTLYLLSIYTRIFKLTHYISSGTNEEELQTESLKELKEKDDIDWLMKVIGRFDCFTSISRRGKKCLAGAADISVVEFFF